MTAVNDAPTTVEAALFFASRDVPVLPLNYPVGDRCSCGKDTCKSPAKHPLAKAVPNGLTDATTDPDIIRAWWERHPHANLGVCTGYAFDALDIDGEPGEQSFLRLAKEYGSPKHIADVLTGREDGGLHLLTVPPGQSVNQTGGRNGMPPGLDVRGLGGYIVAPPSLHISGRRYEWGSHFGDGVLLGNREWGEWLADVKADGATQPPARPADTRFAQPTFTPTGDAGTAYGAAVLRRAVALIESTYEGNRWQTLATEAIPLIARAVDGGCLDLDEAVTALEDAARTVHLDDRSEIRRIRGLTEQMIAKGIRQPIKPPEAAQAAQTFTSEAEARASDWTPPDPLDRPPPPPFPVEVLGWLAEPVTEISRRLQTPPDLAGMMTLALVAACVRGRARVQVEPGWEEPLNLYLAVVLGSGETKSPLLAAITKRLRECETEAQKSAASLIAARSDMAEIAAEKLAKTKRDAAKNSSIENIVEVEEARRHLDSIVVPPKPLYLAGDMTPEALVKILAEQGGTLAHLSAEGGLLDTIVGGRYSAKGSPPPIADLLNAFDGREPIKVHRRSAEDLIVEDPSLTIGLAVQPQVLQALGENVVAMRRGLVARFLFAVPRSLVGTRRMSRGGSVGEAEKAFALLTDAVLSTGVLGTSGISGTTSDEGVSGTSGISGSRYEIEGSSSSLLYQWREHIEPRRHPDSGDLADLGAWINKIDGQVARLAGILQIIRDASPVLPSPRYPRSPGNLDVRTIAPETLADAITLAEYLIEHAKSAFDLMGGEVLSGETYSDARQLRAWIATQCPDGTFSPSEAQQRLKKRARFSTADKIHAAAETLVSTGWLWTIPPDGGKAGRPPIRYLVHPSVYEARE